MDSKRAMSDEKASNTWREAYKAYCAGVSHNKFGNTQAAATVIQSAFAEELAGMEAEIARLRQRVAVLEFEANGPPADGTPISIFDMPHRKP